ncbi:hypothetical protein Q7C36_004336 [Tachysurus vachellii]|uniref:Uncharacterized protein n=1 Tax=Tachysurus vachellii TaxID=175792 RepID=A0AA88NN80_TACVA|nr:hypothetical protein Q7C36_004336 [Tachysurus vachellii]
MHVLSGCPHSVSAQVQLFRTLPTASFCGSELYLVSARIYQSSVGVEEEEEMDDDDDEEEEEEDADNEVDVVGEASD